MGSNYFHSPLPPLVLFNICTYRWTQTYRWVLYLHSPHAFYQRPILIKKRKENGSFFFTTFYGYRRRCNCDVFCKNFQKTVLFGYSLLSIQLNTFMPISFRNKNFQMLSSELFWHKKRKITYLTANKSLSQLTVSVFWSDHLLLYMNLT